MVEATLVSLSPHVARGRPQLASAASGRPELCSYRFYSRCVSILEKKWLLAWTPFIRETFLLAQFFRAEVSRVILSIIELQQTCPNHRHILLFFFVVRVAPFAVTTTGESLEFRTVSCPSGVKSPWFIIWSEAPESPMRSLPLEVLIWCEETLLAGLGLKNLCRFSDYAPKISYTFMCNVQTDVLAMSSMRKVHSIDLPSSVGAFGFRWFWDPVWTTPSVGSLVIGSLVIQLTFP